MPQAADVLTVAASGVVAYFVATVIHEAVGHGVTCVAVRGKLRSVSSVNCDCDYDGLSSGRRRAVEGGGTLANLVVGLVFFAGWKAAAGATPSWRYFLWLSAMVNLFQAGGYLAVSPLAGFGDWSHALVGVRSARRWKLGLTAAGVVISGLALYFGQREFQAFAPTMVTSCGLPVWSLTVVPYLVGAAVACASALLNPVGFALVVRSAAAATLGGTACLFWIGVVTGQRSESGGTAELLASNPVIVGLATFSLLLWVAVLAPGIPRRAPLRVRQR